MEIGEDSKRAGRVGSPGDRIGGGVEGASRSDTGGEKKRRRRTTIK